MPLCWPNLASSTFFSMMVKTRSMPMLTPTHGVCAPEGENMPTKLSYLPPAAMDPTCATPSMMTTS